MAKGALSSRAVGLNPEANGDVNSFPVLSFNRGFEDPLCARHLVQLWGFHSGQAERSLPLRS